VNLAGFASQSSTTADEAIESAIRSLPGYDISAETRSVLEDQLSQDPPTADATHLQRALALVLGSPEFQKK
jgi:hypothetical protein